MFIAAILNLCVLVVVLAILLWYLRLFTYRGLKNIVTPPKIPVIGHLWAFREATEIQMVFPLIQKYAQQWGDLILTWSPMATPFVHISNAKIAAHFLNGTKHITKAVEFNLLELWLGQGLLTSSGKKWHARRKILTPTFHMKILDQFLGVFNKNSNILVNKLRQDIENGTDFVDMYLYFKTFALDVICETAMGTSINAQTSLTATPYAEAIRNFLNIQCEKCFSVWKRINLLFQLFANSSIKEREQLDVLNSFTDSVIDKRRKDLFMNENKNVQISDTKKKLVFIDHLLLSEEDGQPFTQEAIREEVSTFTFAGYDTTASALSFILYELAKHKHVQEKISDELREVFGTNILSEPTSADLQRLNYLELAIKEGLRLYPPVSIISRKLDIDAYIRDWDADNDGILIPKGTTILINIYAIHRNAKYYPDPEKFIPERFLQTDKMCPSAYLPFSIGPRNCIGQKFAMMEMKATLAKLLLNFYVHPNPKHSMQVYSDGILKSFTGLPVKLTIRKSYL